MALTDFWELKDNQLFVTKPMLNVYHVKRIDAGANAQDVIDAFVFSVLTLAFRGAQQLNVTRTTIECQNLGDPTDFASFPSGAFGGTDPGQFPSTFNALTIQFNRTRTDMKNGQKRYAMGMEDDITNGTWLAAFVATMETIRDNILDPWVTMAAPLVDVCNFAILKRFCVDPLQDPCLKYRLPNTDSEVDNFHYVPVAGIVRPLARSQVSRKVL